MIYIFHGDDQNQSRLALNQFLDTKKELDILRVDNKEINLDDINGFINSQSLFNNPKIIVISNLFSIPKTIFDKLVKILKSNPNFDIIIWQEKTLTITQLKIFPKAIVKLFPLDKIIFSCINNLRPKNSSKFIPLLHQTLAKEPFELFLFWIKFNLRKQLIGYSKFNPKSLKKTYLQIIELDFQNKTGQLAISKDLALERILFNLMEY